jgi:hypothetical protein
VLGVVAVGLTRARPRATPGWSTPSRPTSASRVILNPSHHTTARFSFTSSGRTASFQCRLDGGAYSACLSPKLYSGLTKGLHTFSVEAVDPAGNTSKPASYTWRVKP